VGYVARRAIVPDGTSGLVPYDFDPPEVSPSFAGGTLLQLITPLLFVGYFWHRADWHAASVALCWVAQNCGNIATYAADVRAQELPLVGGGEHDWFYLLSSTGQLSHDQGIARAIRAAGVVLLVGAIVWGLVAAGRRVELDRLTSTSLA
jgi:hypothetical protein